MLTDSGGLQEETTFLGVPCITIRENTERPSTIEIGTNYLAGTDPDKILSIANEILEGEEQVPSPGSRVPRGKADAEEEQAISDRLWARGKDCSGRGSVGEEWYLSM